MILFHLAMEMVQIVVDSSNQNPFLLLLLLLLLLVVVKFKTF